MHIAGLARKGITHKKYEGKCKHEKTDHGYGFAGAGYGFKGIGAYMECEDCGSVSWDPDEPTEYEEEWFKNSPLSQGDGWCQMIKESA